MSTNQMSENYLSIDTYICTSCLNSNQSTSITDKTQNPKGMILYTLFQRMVVQFSPQTLMHKLIVSVLRENS